MSIGYAFATVEARILKNSPLVQQIQELTEPVVIVNQFHSSKIPPNFFKKNVTVINSTERGISRSRNLAFKHLNTSLAMICDDDIELRREGIEALKRAIVIRPQVALWVTQLATDQGKLWRHNYESATFSIQGNSFSQLRRIQRINSMEQVYNLDFMRENEIHFDSEFGAGSGKHIMGEETLVSATILQRGGEIRYVPVITRTHPPISSGQKFSPAHVRSVLATQRKIFGFAFAIPFAGYLLKSIIRRITSVDSNAQ